MQIADLRTLLEPQLKDAVPSNGDYLDGLTVDEKIQKWYSDSMPLSYEQKKAHLQKKIAEWEVHAGQRMFFYVLEEKKPDGKVALSVLKAWEDRIPEIAMNHELRDPQIPGSKLPILVQKIQSNPHHI